ncbi:MAG: hypothetical protein DRG40_00710 [Deltaproteobacteria bacterium]|nr:MAG: hypothetical protein DRG40_00710 [Deltaproteobacteria bacterium]
MAETIRQKILQRVAQDLLALNSIKSAEVERLSPLDLDTLPLPSVFVYPGREVRETETMGHETWRLEVQVEAWAKEEQLEGLLGEIHQALYQDRRLGGLALSLVRAGSDMYVVDPSRALGGMLITFEVLYRHAVGDPYNV